MFSKEQQMTADWTATLTGKKLSSAFSSLTEFSCETEGDLGLVLKAVETSTGPSIQAELMAKEKLPREMDAVCRVDWSWIADSTVSGVSFNGSSVRFQLQPAGPLTISVQVWQGKPFLAFQPYRAPK
jgi:hypothetical protein